MADAEGGRSAAGAHGAQPVQLKSLQLCGVGSGGPFRPDAFEESAALWRDVFELEAAAVARLSFQLGFIYCSTSATARCLTQSREKNTALSADTKGTQLQQWAVIKALQQQCRGASLSSVFLHSQFASLFITFGLHVFFFFCCFCYFCSTSNLVIKVN